MELFKIGFLPVGLIDIIDIALVAFITYKLYSLIKGTIAAQIFYGLIFVLLLSLIAQGINLRALSWILRLLSEYWVIAFVILFQPEIRRILVFVGRNPFVKMFFKYTETNIPELITETAFDLARVQHGALIVLIKSSGLKGVVESGEVINAKVNRNLLRSIFYPRSPLHDGAVVINKDIIEAARCTLPLSQKTNANGIDLGMRHRAGLGISEQADVLCVIVSEETGSISVAEAGTIIKGLSKDSLKRILSERLIISKDKRWKGIFESFAKQE